MKHPMYCDVCGTYFIVENDRGKKPEKWECPTCGRIRCKLVAINSDRGACILSTPQDYATAVKYRFSDGHGSRYCPDCDGGQE
jgi:hypothetical protein